MTERIDMLVVPIIISFVFTQSVFISGQGNESILKGGRDVNLEFGWMVLGVSHIIPGYEVSGFFRF